MSNTPPLHAILRDDEQAILQAWVRELERTAGGLRGRVS